MRTWIVTIVMHDGSRGRHHGIYPDGCTAIVRAMDPFPQAARISARCTGGRTAAVNPHRQPERAH